MIRANILGAGFSGLTAAHYLSKAGLGVEIYEAKTEPGGLISTLNLSYGKVETAANAIRNNRLVQDLANEIGVEMCGTLPGSRRRYIYRQGLRQWPLGIWETLAMAGRLALAYLKRGGSIKPRLGESVADWANSVLGKPAAKYLVAPALQGIYAGDIAAMDADLSLAAIFKREQWRGLEVPKQERGSCSPRGGMGELINGLADSLASRNVPIHYGKDNTNFPQNETNVTVICLPAHKAATVLQKLHPDLATALGKVEMLPLVSVTIFSASSDSDPHGFGCLFPEEEGYRVKGVLFNSDIFPNRSEQRSETWIFGGAKDREILALSDADILDIIRDERRRAFAVDSEISRHTVTRWPQAIPHYTEALRSFLEHPGHKELTARGIYLHGNYLGQLGLAGILRRSFALPQMIQEAK